MYADREKHNAYHRAWRKANPEKMREIKRKARLKLEYNMTPREYAELLLAQNGVCAICQHEQKTQHLRLVVDHDHETGKVRGLLCSECNLALGKMKDDADRLRAAAEYLERSK